MNSPSDRQPVVVTVRLPDGRQFDIHTDVDARYADGQLFWWTDGNGGCDCNRSLYLNREYHLDLGEDQGGFMQCLPCGDTIELLGLTVNGVHTTL